MGAVEHLKTLCCLGLSPESAMIAVTPLLHEIIPHGWFRLGLLEPDGRITGGYAENPAAADIYRERVGHFIDDPSAPVSVLKSAFLAGGIGWTLHQQGRGYLDSAYYREIEAPLDSCWLLDAMIADGGRTFAGLCLGRPRCARPFNVDDVLRLDPLRPWLAHAFRPQATVVNHPTEQNSCGMLGVPVRSGQMILMAETKLIFQTPGTESLLAVITGELSNYMGHLPMRDRLPAPILYLVRQIAGAANGTSNTPPRMRISTPYGVVTLEAKWLVPGDTLPEDAARDPNDCLISVTMELREHPIAHAARVLRESGATPAQMNVGIKLALGLTKPVIADELGIQITSVADLTRKLYQTLDVHNSAELSTKIWLGHTKNNARQNLRRTGLPPEK